MSRRVSTSRILLHVILTLLTGGLWLIVLGVRFMLSNS